MASILSFEEHLRLLDEVREEEAFISEIDKEHFEMRSKVSKPKDFKPYSVCLENWLSLKIRKPDILFRSFDCSRVKVTATARERSKAVDKALKKMFNRLTFISVSIKCLGFMLLHRPTLERQQLPGIVGLLMLSFAR